MSTEHEPPPELPEPLPKATEGWLEGCIAELRGLTAAMSGADSPDEVMRRAISGAREAFGFNRISAWLFEEGRRSLTGTFGVNADGELVDERHCRVFDHGSIAPQIEAWTHPPYYFVDVNDALRDSEGGVVAKGVHMTAPLMHQGECMGYVSIDDLLESAAMNDKSGALLGLFADAVAAQYFLKVAESRALSAEAASERADALKREFLGVLSHEVRTPLNAILGFAQLLCMESDSPNQVQLAKTIEDSGDHLLNLLTGMMEYANLAHEDLRRRFSPCDPVRIAQETVDSFAEFAGKRNLKIAFRHAGDFDGFVQADPVGLRQVFANLVQNAIKFTAEGTITVSVQTQSKSQEAIQFYISVEDTGCGIDEEHLKSIFKPFKQIDSSLTRDHGGIGMGLAIVERLVWAMGGRIACRSDVGKGSCFSIDFVFARSQEAPRAVAPVIDIRPAAAKARSRFKILVAEDDENNRNLLLSLLSRLGYPEPDCAVNGEEAARLIAQRPYDMLLFDLQMPKVDGLSLTRMVREGRCGPINCDSPIVGLTAHNNQYDRDRCISAGMNDYLVKPFKAGDLEAAMGQLIEC